MNRRGSKRLKKKKPTLDWVGGLREYRYQYTALELQRKALEWRGQEGGYENERDS
jgi:hypothetical protein